MRKTRKIMALVLALSMIMVLFAGVAQASTEVVITGPANLLAPIADRVLGTITIASSTMPAVAADTATVVTLTLPAGVTWDSPDVVVIATPTPASITRVDAQTARIVVTSTSAISTIEISPRVDIASDFRGDVNVTVAVSSENLTHTAFHWARTETRRFGVVRAAEAIATVPTATNVQRGVGAQVAGVIRVVEGMPATISTGTAIRISLPVGVTFVTTPAPTTTASTTNTIGIATPVAFESGNRVMVATTTASSSLTATTLNFASLINVDSTVADGPIIATISGAGVATANLTIANVGAVGIVAISARNLPPDPITAGRIAEVVADLRFTENLTDALLGNRTLTLTLPDGFTWNLVDFADNIVANETTPIVTDGGRTLSYWTVSNPAQTVSNHFDITEVRVNARIDAPVGDIVVTVGGNAGVAGTATVGTLRRPVTTVAVSAPNVRADASGQVLGNIVITELFTGAIGSGTITVELPVGFSFDGRPNVDVRDVAGTEHSITFPATPIADRTFTFNVTAASGQTTSTAITISRLRVNADRAFRPWVGTLDVTVSGSAVLEASGALVGNTLLHNVSHGAAVGGNLAVLTVGNVVTATARRTVFTVDSTNSTVDGVAQPALDVAPVIVDGRTFMPIRAAAAAAGVTGDNILFDAGVITIIRGDRVAQFTLGSRVMVVNGVAMNMDVAPSLVAGRALIPIRWVGTALGVPVLWDATARTITVTVQ